MPKQKKYLRDQNGLDDRVWNDYCSEKYTAKEMCKKHHIGMTRYYKILKSFASNKTIIKKGGTVGIDEENLNLQTSNVSRFDEFKKNILKSLEV